MKEIVAVLRMNKVQHTRDALAEKGHYAMTVKNVLGRGKQKGLQYELEGDSGPQFTESPRIHYIPKRLLMLLVTDDHVQEVVETIIKANQTGNIGDGKIFICPVEDAIRVRTKETGDRAIL
ncbi:MAG: P-II family nitrogen regulator [Chloroflexi bacterium]|jgi:nitrogen regulatory protein PII 2|uniref:P-II family nitrogen regulator n=1 Tax=Candidatus Chlorohelix allophototropha TaxID=3003348 RepID=A0A8T7M9F6_9CHLR|nr:P-II family nitrogen regulator [Chloroflexota bacterium]WJW68689.1 P-II family nitrogen regulator [Chloroflexota bacterium L227-S17]